MFAVQSTSPRYLAIAAFKAKRRITISDDREPARLINVRTRDRLSVMGDITCHGNGCARNRPLSRVKAQPGKPLIWIVGGWAMLDGPISAGSSRRLDANASRPYLERLVANETSNIVKSRTRASNEVVIMDESDVMTPLKRTLFDDDDTVNRIERLHSEVMRICDGFVCAGCGNRGPYKVCTNCHTDEQSRPYISALENRQLSEATLAIENALLESLE